MLRVRSWVLLVALGASVARADVVTTLSGSSLVVSGDGSANAVAIEPGLDGVTVVGFDGTLVDGSSQGVTVPGVRRLTLPDGLDLRLGRGNDSVWIDDVDVGAARIQTGNGNDAVSVFDASLNRL